MAYENYGQIYRDVLVYAPATPLPLAKKLVRDAYRSVIDRYRWSALRKQEIFRVTAPVASSDVTGDSAISVVPGTRVFETSHDVYVEFQTTYPQWIGQQLICDGKSPIYTITDVQLAGTLPEALLITVDMAVGAPANSGSSYIPDSWSIQPVYLTPADDFDMFISVIDVDNNWRIRTDVLQEVLDKWDANRSSTGTPWVLAATSFNAATATGGTLAGVPRYELWPRYSGAKQYPYRYYKRADLVEDTDVPIWPLSHRTEVLKQFALAEIAKWPGTKDKPNPYFNIQLFNQHKQDFLDELYKLQKQDQEVAGTDQSYADSWSQLPFSPLDAKFIQNHAY